jgi:hypothetical protein
MYCKKKGAEREEATTYEKKRKNSTKHRKKKQQVKTTKKTGDKNSGIQVTMNRVQTHPASRSHQTPQHADTCV